MTRRNGSLRAAPDAGLRHGRFGIASATGHTIDSDAEENIASMNGLPSIRCVAQLLLSHSNEHESACSHEGLPPYPIRYSSAPSVPASHVHRDTDKRLVFLGGGMREARLL